MSQSLSPRKNRSQRPSGCLTPTTSSFLASSSALLAQPTDPNTPEIVDIRVRRIRGADAIHTFRNQNRDDSFSNIREKRPLELPGGKGTWWDMILKLKRIKKGLLFLGVVAFVFMLLYALSLKSQLAGMEQKNRRTVWVKEDLDELLNGDRVGCRE
ncbi:hypothetical protein N431DRAFT_457802 [Stipitochalara longipes BDJ]|nr:hypothetical protein N431DRAFT_457802 [Stipitochalara longipes BDJ]